MKSIRLLTLSLTPLLVSCVAMADRDDEYLDIVKAYANTLIEHGRDTYGEKHTPLFATCLDRETLQLFPESEKRRLFQIRMNDWEGWQVRNSERCFTGANPQKDENLYQILYALTEITGDKRWADEADKTLAYFFNNLQSKTTGLLCWGEHMGWSFRTEAVDLKPAAHNSTHEFGRAWVLWDRSFDVAPRACQDFALGLWNHQIADQEIGNFSRHAGYFEHKPELDSEYPRHGGFYIATWGEAYARTKDPVFLKAIDVLVSGFDRRRSPVSGAVPAESAKRSGGKMLWSTSNLALAIDTWDASEKIPERLATKLRAFCRKTDTLFLSLKHEVGPEGRGFFFAGHLDTLEPFGEGTWAGYSGPWEAGTANNCYIRYKQVLDSRYRDLVIGAATNRLLGERPPEEFIHPSLIGAEIYLMLHAHELTGDRRFLTRADEFARQGIELFMDDVSPLPKATQKYDHYEAVTGADSLMMALLKLWVRKNQPDTPVHLVWSSR